MNPAIFLFTLMRLASPRSLFSMFMLTVGFPFLAGTASRTDDIADLLLPLLTHSLLPMLIAFMIVAEQVANAKNLADGEYMALLFTRPIPRVNYVVTKWLAGSVGVMICVFISYFMFISGESLARGAVITPDPLELLSIVLNCCSSVALIVTISCVPLRMGMFLFVLCLYVSMFGPLLTNYGIKAHSSSSAATVAAIGWILQLLQTILRPSVDITEMANSAHFSWMPLIGYLSNLCIYLFVATWIMNKREFYYASE